MAAFSTQWVNAALRFALMLRFLRRLWAWILQLMGKSPQVEPLAAAPERPLSDLDYGGCLFALIEAVEAGGSRASLQAILIRRRMSAARLADWLSTFSERWVVEAEAHQVLAGQLQRLGRMASPPLGSVATEIGQQLEIGSDEADESANDLATEENLFVEQFDAAYEEKSFEKALMIANRYKEQCPKSSVDWNNRGHSLANLGRYEPAIESYDRAIASPA